MPVVIIGKTSVAARLLRYTEKEKAGGTEPRVLYSEGIRCRVPTAEREFAAVRRVHGKQGAKRTAPAKYALPEAGEVATHVRRSRPNGRKYWAIAGGGQMATHVRCEGDGYVDEIEAVHVIVSYGLDEVNPEDSGAVRRAFEFVATMMAGLYPGVQMKLVGQADGAGKAFHVHCVQNAVVVERMEVDGKVWEPGRKMSGALTDIDRLRERVDEFIEQHGVEYGVAQKLPSVEEQKQEKRSTRDRRMATQGKTSNHDVIRAAFETSMNDVRSVHLGGFIKVMAEHEVLVNHRVTRLGKPGEKHSLSYRLGDMKTPVRGTTLGDHYAYESTVRQLEANTVGTPRESRPKRHKTGARKPLPVSTPDELAEALAVVERFARDERSARAEEQAEADFFPAVSEDFDAAVEANRTGDHAELARLARATRDRRALQRTQQVHTTATAIPDVKAQGKPMATPEPRQPHRAVTTTEPEAHEQVPAPQQASLDAAACRQEPEESNAVTEQREALSEAPAAIEDAIETAGPATPMVDEENPHLAATKRQWQRIRAELAVKDEPQPNPTDRTLGM